MWNLVAQWSPLRVMNKMRHVGNDVHVSLPSYERDKDSLVQTQLTTTLYFIMGVVFVLNCSSSSLPLFCSSAEQQ